MQAHSECGNCESCVSACALSSNCSTATRSSSRGEDVASDMCSDIDASALSSDDEQAVEAEMVASVQWHLELMNTAAEDTNFAQNSLNAHVHEKYAQMKRWAVASDRLARSIGVERMAKAKPWLEANRVLMSARADVTKASEQYMIELESGASEGKLSELMAKHANALGIYQDAQHVLSQLQQKKRFGPAHIAALRPYVQADEEHSVLMADIQDKIQHSERNLNFAKERYRKALRSLEELSEETHRRRERLLTTDDA